MSRFKALGALVIFFLIVSLATPPAMADAEDNLTYQGNKARIAVGQIKDKADCGGEIAEAIGEMLSTALSNNDKFIVLASQEEVDELIDEIELGESEYVEEGRGADKGLMEGADILVSGAVTGFEPNAGGSGGVLGGLKKKAFGEVGLSKKEAKILMDIKLIDIRTRRIIKAMSLEGKASKWSAEAAGGGWVNDVALAGALGAYSNEPMESAVRDVLAKAVDKMAKEIPKDYYRYQGQGEYTKEYGAGGGASAGEARGEKGSGSKGETGTGASKPAAENMKLFTKFDFIPGDKTIFYDDLSGEEVGEFPSRWKLIDGVFEIAQKGDLNLIMCSDGGSIRPKMAASLPDRYTIEWEIYSNGAEQRGHFYHLHILDANEETISTISLTDGENTKVVIFDKEVASKALPAKLGKGIHTIRVMATKTTMKCYIDNERVANIPDIEYFEPVMLKLEFDPWDEKGNPMLAGKFRVAEGGKTMRQQLDETGKIVTHGILFDSGSDVIKGESYKTLQEIGNLLTNDTALRLSIEGHTDSDGADDFNMELSRKRAESVRNYIVSEFGIAADRLESKGWGESKPVDTNDNSEGKANNRRVELIKL